MLKPAQMASREHLSEQSCSEDNVVVSLASSSAHIAAPSIVFAAFRKDVTVTELKMPASDSSSSGRNAAVTSILFICTLNIRQNWLNRIRWDEMNTWPNILRVVRKAHCLAQAHVNAFRRYLHGYQMKKNTTTPTMTTTATTIILLASDVFNKWVNEGVWIYCKSHDANTQPSIVWSQSIHGDRLGLLAYRESEEPILLLPKSNH